ncbi:MAG TPA: hypothetical protein VE053_10610 [Allosphingosinicella sp.]|nr:hypothetical protein [Allosphingosinicella sp.]
MIRTTALLSISAITLAACTPNLAENARPPQTLLPPAVSYGTQVVMGRCMPGAEALIPAILGSVIAQGVNRIGSAIQAAAAQETKVVVARRNIEMRAMNDSRGLCVFVARGWFYRDAPTFAAAGVDPSPFYAKPGSAFKYAQPDALWRNGLFIAATPDFFFQGKVVKATDNSAYSIIPIEATMDKPISTTPLRPSNMRRVLVSFAVTEVGKGVDLNKGGGTTMVIGPMRPGVRLTFPKGLCAAYLANGSQTPNQCPEEGKFDVLMRSNFESEWFSLGLAAKSKPMNLQALVSETRDASEFLGFVAAVFGDIRGDLTTELKENLISSVGAAAEEVELSAEEKAENELDAAYAKAVTELRACVATPADSSKRSTARAALRALIAAARKAERTAFPVDGADLESIVPADDDPQPCQTVLTKLG